MYEKILIVDDDIPLTRTLERILTTGDYHPLVAHTAEDGLRLALSEDPDLVLLDVMIPSMGGWEACRQLRQRSDVPVLFLTALGDTENVVHGLEIGADDYIVKPFEPPVILARIKAHLRRMNAPDKSPQQFFSFNDGALEIDLTAHTVTLNGEDVSLTRREFDLLSVLITNAGRVMTTDELVRQAWGRQYSSDNIKPYVHYLRKKIEPDPSSPRYVLTVRGVGYRFADD